MQTSGMLSRSLTSCFSMFTWARNLWHSLRGSLLSFDVRNDATTETKFIAVDYKSLTTGKVEMDRFFGTKDFRTIETQSIHANEYFKGLN